jgi:uncharacterized membrane protein YtjA (UPF0391 family)
MLGWAITFLIIALIAAVLGFGGVAAASAGIAKLLFFAFLVMCVILFYLWLERQGSAKIQGSASNKVAARRISCLWKRSNLLG